MSAITTSVLKLTVGVLVNKFRDTTANRLKEGDLTDEKCRQLIVRELDDIKSKLDALIRKDLLSSVEFFRDGMNYLEMAIQESGSMQHAEEETSVEDEASLGISVAQRQLNIVSEERFKKAQEKFKTAGEEATRAFSNPALSTEDKILATKLRITCSILEGIQDIHAAIKAAVMYLERLHDLPAIQEAFSVHLNGGFKSMFSKTKRLEIVQAVSIINHELFGFSRMFAQISIDLFAWPKIELDGQEYQPILRHPSIPLEEFGITAKCPYTTSFTSVKVILSCSTINSKWDVIAQVAKATIYIFFAKPASKTDQHKKFCSFPEEDQKKPAFEIISLAIDANDNLYAISIHQPGHNKKNLAYTLYMFNSKGVLTHQCLLEFLNCDWVFFDRASIVVNKLGQIVMSRGEDKQIYVFNSNGELQRKFAKENYDNLMLNTVYLTNSDTNEIIAAQYGQNTVYVYTTEGKYNRAFHPPKGHTMDGIAFNHIRKSIILLTCASGQMYLLSYGPNADTPQMLQLDNVDKNCELRCHANGPVALIAEDGVLFI